MPEGDTVWRTAANLHAALAGSILTRTDFRVPAHATLDLSGAVVTGAVSRGKHILIRTERFTDSGTERYTIHSHLRMEGTWQLYRNGARWRRPAHQARVVLETESVQAVGFALGVMQVVLSEDEGTVVGHLGPDLLAEDWDEGEALRRLRAQRSQSIFVALHDQRNVAGLGNEYINELCFVSGVHPATPVADVPDLSRLLQRAHSALRANLHRVERTLTGDTRPGRRSWVFSREGIPCLRCGTTIRRTTLGRRGEGTQGVGDRIAYWCPRCQPAPG